jgi:hypothetical protein
MNPPTIEAEIPLLSILLYAVLNPATILVAFWLGRKADQFGKLLIAAFAGAFAGVAVLYFAALFGISSAPTLGRAAAGIFVVSLVAGLIYARIGYAFRARPTNAP